MGEMGKFLFIAGLCLAGAGALFWLLPGKFGWFGHLPGDIRIERPNFRFYFPITTLLLLNLAFGLVMWILGRFRR
jgi:hypothetical protein